MNKFAAILGAIALTLSAGSALAQSGDVNIPGIGKAKGSAGSTIKNSTINVIGNKSGSVLAIGGEVDAKIAGARMSGVANVTVKDSRTLQVVAFERNMLAAVDKAIQSAGLNLNPTNLGELLLISMPALTEETRKGFTKQARSAAEDARVAVRNIRRDALGDLKKLVKDKEISEDEERRAVADIDKLTKDAEAQITKATEEKEKDLMAV